MKNKNQIKARISNLSMTEIELHEMIDDIRLELNKKDHTMEFPRPSYLRQEADRLEKLLSDLKKVKSQIIELRWVME